MATIKGNLDEKIVTMNKWLGLWESEDGDVETPLGAATVCKNWRVTRDRNLKRRSGYEIKETLGTGKVQGIWTGEIDGKTELLASCDSHLYRLWDDDNRTYIKEDLGTIDTTSSTTFFPFAGVVYIMDGEEYYKYDGERLSVVHGYRPLLYTALEPSGAIPEGGSMLEEVNKLTGERRVWYSPNGSDTVYHLPEQNIITVDYVMKTADGSYISPSDYTFNTALGTVTFTTAPTTGTNTIEIGYSMVNTVRREVTKKKYAEIYSGYTDMRIVIYGDGTNQALYSGMDYNGTATVEYFPDLNAMAIGDANTPITSMIRHSSALLAFKTDSAWSISYSTIQTATGDYEAGFYITPINKTIGNTPIGQVVQVTNFPYTLNGTDLYEWKPSSRYATTLAYDERTAKRISDRIYSTLSSFDMPNVRVYDDNYHQEYYICNPVNNEALVWNYVSDAWYYYDHFPMNCAVVFDDDLLFGSTDGKIERMNENIFSDNGVAFTSLWESGSMDFGTPYRRKFSSEMWIVIKPQSRGHVGVTVRTDKKSDFDVKDTDSYLMDFWDIDFSDFSFDVNRSPRTYRHRLKAKKFTFYKLVLESDDDTTSATVLNASFKIRLTGYAK